MSATVKAMRARWLCFLWAVARISGCPSVRRLRLTAALHSAAWCSSNCPDIALHRADGRPPRLLPGPSVRPACLPPSPPFSIGLKTAVKNPSPQAPAHPLGSLTMSWTRFGRLVFNVFLSFICGDPCAP